MKRYVIPWVGILLIASGNIHAGPSDGLEDFSLDQDQTVLPGGGLAPAPGQINWSPENGTFGNDFVIAPLQTGDEIDALSAAHPDHNVSLDDMLFGGYNLDFSVDGDSNIFEYEVSGPPPQPLGPGRNNAMDGHFPATPNPAGIPQAHDSAADLGLENHDLDALEHHEHVPPYPSPFPGAPTNWENTPSNVYYSTEYGITDVGDVFNWGNGPVPPAAPYVDDTAICAAFAAAGLPCDDTEFNIDGLIVYDVVGSQGQFEQGIDTLSSDAIFFSLAPGVTDPIGDNVYWYSATGVGGLYTDLGLTVNVDALDNHISEPFSLALFGFGLAGMAALRRKQGRTNMQR